MKKFIAISLSLCLMLSLFSFACVSASESETEGIFTLLRELSIMTGDPDGDLRLDDAVTRAEFTKVAVAASSYKNNVATNLAISPFPDVTYKHWAAPYVRVGVVNGLVSGYPDATFRPDDTVLFEEGVTILLRVLGYTDADFGASWPYGQISLANNLELTDKVTCMAGDVMNRRQVARLIYNALRTKFKGQSNQLASVFDVTISDDVTLISDSSDDSSIASDEVYTNSGTYKITNSFDCTQLGTTGTAAVKNGNKLIAFVPDGNNSDSEQYILYSVLPEAVMVYKNGALTQLTIKDNTTVYKGKTQSSFGNLKSTLELGDILRVKQSSTGIDYITCTSGNTEGPGIVSSGGWNMSWQTNDQTKVMRDGHSSSLSRLEPYDVAYFLPDLNLVLAYSDKVSGIYESATPNKDMPQSITVSGKTYQIESGNAFTALSSGGAFAFGDTVTLLLGKNGGVAGVISPKATTTDTLVGYVLETGRKNYQTGVTGTYNGYYVKVVHPDGTTGEYATNTDKSSFRNKVVTVSFKNGYANLGQIKNEANTISGTYSHSKGTLGKYAIAADADILDIGTLASGNTSMYCKIFPQRLDGVTISSNEILYSEKNSAGKIDKLILLNVTNDSFHYGLMTYAKEDTKHFSGSYTYMVNDQMYQQSFSNKVLNIPSGSALKISGNPSNPDTFSKLSELVGDIKITTATSLTCQNTSYPISPTVFVYQKSASLNGDYVRIPINDIVGKDNLTISAYMDKFSYLGGQVRVIVVY
jgi:hypothetical protein